MAESNAYERALAGRQNNISRSQQRYTPGENRNFLFNNPL